MQLQEVKNVYFGISSFYCGGFTAFTQCKSHDHKGPNGRAVIITFSIPHQARLGYIDVKITTDVMSKLHAYLKVGLRLILNMNMTSHKSSLYDIFNNDISSWP